MSESKVPQGSKTKLIVKGLSKNLIDPLSYPKSTLNMPTLAAASLPLTVHSAELPRQISKTSVHKQQNVLQPANIRETWRQY